MTRATRSSDRSTVRLGILWMLVAQLLFFAGNAVAKHLAETYPVPLVIWARLAFQMLLLAPLLPRLRPLLVTRRMGMQVVRAAFLVSSTGFFYLAIHILPLADASAILYIAPLLITVLSMPLLGERVGAWQWVAVAIGFAGALIVIRPGVDFLQPALVIPLAAALGFAFVQISSRSLGRTDPPMTTFVHTTIVSALLASAAVPFFWITPSVEGWVTMAAIGVLSGGGQFAMIKAFAWAPAAVVAPFNYTGLVWAILFGFFVFGEIPDIWIILGATLITTSGLYIFRREHPVPGTPG
jgi:drug/metabolite transporter (DMT)-like permease